MTQQLNNYVDAVEHATNKVPVLYIGADFANRYTVPIERTLPLWLASFPNPPLAAHWTIWQVDSSASVTGVVGAVDLDVRRTTT